MRATLAAGLSLIPLAAVTAGAAPAVRPSDPAEKLRHFESRVRPLLVAQCGGCHSSEKRSGGLALDSAAGLMKGGGRGPVVTPEHPEQSLVIQALRHEPGVPAMPPGRQLSRAEIADLERWIRDGALWPESGGVVRAGADHWSFQPIRRLAVPKVRRTEWVRTPIDAFILARLEAKGLSPAPPADRRTLIRRVTFDLTGLPPRPEEVDAFVRDPSPDAWEKVVERLLVSPHYGERWGRHWLDVARYADSNGLDENVHYGNAWRYRDWVISVFNRDIPYDRFLRMQIAGDLLPARNQEERRENLVASGFFSLGPKFISEVDDLKVQMDTVDEQLDTLGRTVMGMTLGCARCHDHKFDPIGTRDYYALAGIFKSSLTLQVMKKPRMWHEHSLATEADRARLQAWEGQVVRLKEEIDRLAAEEAARLKSAGASTLAKDPEPLFREEARARLKALREELAGLEKNPPALPAAMGLTEGQVADIPIHIRGSFLELGPVVPRGVPTVLNGPPRPIFDARESGRRQLADWLVHPAHPLTGRVVVNRVWRWRFGEGLVGSPDNFGMLGERPSHPELLDWLAATFMAPVGDREGCGWSFKRLHRLMLLSNTYRMSAQPDPRALAVDPENRLRWRWEARRLTAEEIRDAILAVGGLLDRTMGGTLIPLKNREYFFDHTSKDATRYDSLRRSVYLPVVRNHLYDVFQLFDFGDGAVPEGNRPTTTVAPQALFMLNSELVWDAASALARQLLGQPGTDAERVARLFERLYARRAQGDEVRSLLALGRDLRAAECGPESEQRVWTRICQVALAANEFVYLK